MKRAGQGVTGQLSKVSLLGVAFALFSCGRPPERFQVALPPELRQLPAPGGESGPATWWIDHLIDHVQAGFHPSGEVSVSTQEALDRARLLLDTIVDASPAGTWHQPGPSSSPRMELATGLILCARAYSPEGLDTYGTAAWRNEVLKSRTYLLDASKRLASAGTGSDALLAGIADLAANQTLSDSPGQYVQAMHAVAARYYRADPVLSMLALCEVGLYRLKQGDRSGYNDLRQAVSAFTTFKNWRCYSDAQQYLLKDNPNWRIRGRAIMPG